MRTFLASRIKLGANTRVAYHAIVALLLVLVVRRPVLADVGKPIAVRWWGQATVSIETYWNLQIVIDPYPPTIGYGDPHLSADLVLITHEHPDHNHAQLIGGEPVVVHGLGEQGSVQKVNHVLDRLPNAEKPTWRAAEMAAKTSGHEVQVSTVPAWHDDEQGAERGANAIFVVDVDGVRIVHCGDLGQSRLTDEQLAALGQVDVLLLPIGGIYTIDGPQAFQIIAQVKPRIVVPIHFKTAALAFNLHGIEPFVEAIGDRWPLKRATQNTLAVSAAKPDTDRSTQVVILDYLPWLPEGELAELFAAMQSASRESQAVFEPLTVSQMSFRPSDGTHTPRWNAEHMMGTQLRFFTQLYSQLDPAIVPIQLNPAQMPADYQPAHPDWSGAEEARQMERAGALVQRFGYLLDGAQLDERGPGSPWPPRRLFQQMERHFGQHTANVKKKFELPDWPD